MEIKKRLAGRGRSYAQMIREFEGPTPEDNVCPGCGHPIGDQFCTRTFQYDGDYWHPECLIPEIKRDLAESDSLIPPSGGS